MTYTYLTNDNTLPTYRIVLLYKQRWDNEKIFHQFKSKKWSSANPGPAPSKPSKAMQSSNVPPPNLLLILEHRLRINEGLHDELEEKKQQGRSKAARVACKAADVICVARNSINTALQRATKCTARFIRWVRVCIYQQAPWSHFIARPKEIWGGIY
jgi:hypothetical protein